MDSIGSGYRLYTGTDLVNWTNETANLSHAGIQYRATEPSSGCLAAPL
jgi:hypothetical protein